METISDADKVLSELFDEGIASIAALKVLNYIRIPRRYEDIHRETGIDRTVVRKMINRSPGLMKKVPLPVNDENRERGKPPVAIVATERGKQLIDKLIPLSVERP